MPAARLAALILLGVGFLALSPAAPLRAQTAPPASLQPGDAFGEAVTLTARPMVVKKGSGTWDKAYDDIVDALKAVKGQLDKAGIKPAGAAMTVFSSSDDTGFDFETGYPVAEAPAAAPEGLGLRQSPAGKALKFVHRGSYDALTTTDEAITNYLDEKRIDPSDLAIEEYVADPTVTADDQLIINLYVPIK